MLTGDTAIEGEGGCRREGRRDRRRATTENDSDNSAAAYEVHVTKADGSHVVVILDKSYAVLSVETQPQGGFGPTLAPRTGAASPGRAIAARPTVLDDSSRVATAVAVPPDDPRLAAHAQPLRP